MKLRGGNMTHLTVVAVFLLKLCSSGAEESPTCHQNSTSTFFVSDNKACEDYSWNVNGTAVAYDGVSNETLVQDYGPTYIIFKSCQTDVTYFCKRGMMITCESICPTKSGHESHREVHDADKTTTNPQNIQKGGENHVDNNNVGGGIVAVIVIAVVAAVVIVGVIVWWRCKKRARDSVV